MRRLLITGGRDLADPEIVWLPLWIMVHTYEQMIVVHGDAPGADTFAHEWCELPGQQWNQRPPVVSHRGHRRVERLVLEERHPADWTRHGKAAGPIRNQEMIDAGADGVFAFPTAKSRGTYDCMARAWVRGIPVFVYSTTNLGEYHRLSEVQGEHLARHVLHWPSDRKVPT